MAYNHITGCDDMHENLPIGKYLTLRLRGDNYLPSVEF